MCWPRYRLLVAALLVSLASSAPTTAAAQQPSPERDDSMPLLTPERREVLRRLYRAGHPWAKFCQEFADRQTPVYGDMGQWSLMTWIMTGERRYARAAIERAGKFPRETNDRNYTRSSSHYYALCYLWLREEMTDKERKEWEDKLRYWALSMLGRGAKGVLTRAEDSDEVVGHYFGLALIDKALGSDYLRQPAGDSSVNAAKMREQIRRYCQLAAGGEWIESSEYNVGTLQLLLIGAAAAGLDEFPEVQQLLPEVSEQLRWSITPDLKDSVQWGDVQEPHNLHLSSRVSLMAMVIGLGGDPDGKLTALLARLTGDQPIYPGYWMALYRALWFFDPQVLKESGGRNQESEDRGPQGLRIARGMGLAIYRDQRTLLQAHFPEPVRVDHEQGYLGDVRLWLDGEWVLDHPIGYGAGYSAQNVGLVAGLGAMNDRGFISGQTIDRGVVLVGGTKGPRHLPPYYDPPPAFLQEWTRKITYQPGKLTVRDSFRGKMPARIDRYYPAERKAIEAAMADKALWQQIFHTPVQPAEIDDGYEWQTPGGRTIRLTTTAQRREATPEKNGENISGYFHQGVLSGWQIRFISSQPKTEIVTTLEVVK